uniref:tyrosine-type recombinase/integrase n=1 Tax=Actinacidiphila soli TaxID=2487275 RepID=UPI000FCB11FD
MDEATRHRFFPELEKEPRLQGVTRSTDLRVPGRRSADPNTDYHRWKKLLTDAGVRDRRLHDARHTAGTVLLLLGVPDAVVDAIMGWEPGGAARMRARCMHLTGPMPERVAGQIGDALRGAPDSTDPD